MGRERRRRSRRSQGLVIATALCGTVVAGFAWHFFSATSSDVRLPKAPEERLRISPIDEDPARWSVDDVCGLLVELDTISEAAKPDDARAQGLVRRWEPRVDAYFAEMGISRTSRAAPSDPLLSSLRGMLFVAYVASVYPSIAVFLDDGGAHRDALITANAALSALLRLTSTNGEAIEETWGDRGDDSPTTTLLHRVAPQRRDWTGLRQRLALRRTAVLEELFALETPMIAEYHAVYLYTFIVVLRGCDHGMRHDYKDVVPRGADERTRLVETALLAWCQTKNLPNSAQQLIIREQASTPTRVKGLTSHELSDIARLLNSSHATK